MTHCIIMTAYKDDELINTFLSKVPRDWGVYIHIDRKSKLQPSDIRHANAFIEKKYKIYWGGQEHLLAFLDLLANAHKKHFDYYHLVTGQDYFASSPENFDDVVGDIGNNYIEIHPLPRPGWWNGGYEILQYKTFTSYFNIKKGVKHKIHQLFWDLQKLLHIKHSLPSYPLYCGSVYCSLTDAAVDFSLNSDVSLDLINRTRNSICSEEIFFQSVIMNSPYKDKVVNNNLRYIDWSSPIRGNVPAVLNESYFDDIVSSGRLFCRKIDSNKSAKLLQLLNSTLRLQL